ncbi:MAG: DUF523 domain-containing protein, partial [Oscillospiraceae bacterium]|nr:DUF523 domain-containing protein [Oscillospiraceae bacterium]
MMRDGTDVTAEYKKGAETALYLANIMNTDFAILKANSPSCGKDNPKSHSGAPHNGALRNYDTTRKMCGTSRTDGCECRF